MKTEWEYAEESETRLESWRATHKGVHLIVEYVNELDVFFWHNLLTGSTNRTGSSQSLYTAMADAIRSVDEHETVVRGES